MPIRYPPSVHANALKLVAVLAMLIDHVAYWLAPKGTIWEISLHAAGRLTAPIMCFLIAEGYFHTSDLRRYMSRLFVFAAISHFPFVWFVGMPWWQGTSVIWSLFMGLVALSIARHPKIGDIGKWWLVLLCGVLAWTADWSYIGVLWIVCFGLFRGRFKLQMLSFAAIGTFCYILPGILDTGLNSVFRFGILSAIPLLALYNGERGRKSKVVQWGFYVFYPLHLFVLYVCRAYIF